MPFRQAPRWWLWRVLKTDRKAADDDCGELHRGDSHRRDRGGKNGGWTALEPFRTGAVLPPFRLEESSICGLW
jgi:hypothetical protein